MAKLLAIKKREKKEEQEAKKRIKEQILRDKQERASKVN